jgi:predicted SnoaL-like aldol condensation-catalyzing enzyme
MAASGHAAAAFAQYATSEFRHHNPHFRGDAQSLARAMDQNAAQFPAKTLDVQRVLCDGDQVAVHSRVRHAPGAPEVAVVHLFRFEGLRIAELWDVGQAAPQPLVNEHGMF